MSASYLLMGGLGALFLGLLLAIAVMVSGVRERQQVTRALGAMAHYDGNFAVQPQESNPEPAMERLVKPALSGLVKIARRVSPVGTADRLSKRLDYLGNPPGWTVERVLAMKALSALVLGGGAAFVLGSHFLGTAFWLLVGLAGGFFLPDLLLYNASTKRQSAIQKALPDALDLLVVSVEAGLGFDAALLTVVRKTTGPLSKEFARVLQEIQIGVSRSAAIRALGERTTIAELRAFVTALVQADRLGIPIANVLREQAKEMRSKRQQRAEEKAQKVPVKILFPLVFCILPSLFVITIGPGAINIMHTLSQH